MVLLRGVFGRLGLGDSPLAVVLSTLPIAGLFSSLRRRIQLFIDRRFYRRRYDMERTLSAFGSHTREKLELDSLLKELLSVTQQALQPEHASLWVRDARATSSQGTNSSREE